MKAKKKPSLEEIIGALMDPTLACPVCKVGYQTLVWKMVPGRPDAHYRCSCGEYLTITYQVAPKETDAE